MDMNVDVEDLPKNTKREKDFEFHQHNQRRCYSTRIHSGLVKKDSKKAWTAEYWQDSKWSMFLLNYGMDRYHDVDSNEMAFKIAASMAIQDACKMARPVILEPMMKVEVVTPDKFMGDVQDHYHQSVDLSKVWNTEV
jgi:hypothetical protein